ncbi:MAG: hypothetical protein EAZ17_09765 [Sphingobacteriales bacterium]|nr:MAG: hypothetical protein EAZ17_09765 [Sphingobacteriales bacterium]
MRKFLPGLAMAALLFSCNKQDFDNGGNGGKIPESTSFQALSTLVIATDPTKPAGAAEISTFHRPKKLVLFRLHLMADW